MTRYAAILLAGGRATRLGGAPKPLQRVGDRTLLDIAVDAARAAGCAPVTAVGPALAEREGVEWVREEPAFGGPCAAIATALAAQADRGVGAEWTLVLACDLPRVGEVVPSLAAAAELVPADTDGVCLGDERSRPQWLTGLYRSAPLRRAAHALPEGGRDLPVRALMDDLAITVLADRTGASRDVDTWEDLEQARREDASREDGDDDD